MDERFSNPNPAKSQRSGNLGNLLRREPLGFDIGGQPAQVAASCCPAYILVVLWTTATRYYGKRAPNQSPKHLESANEIIVDVVSPTATFAGKFLVGKITGNSVLRHFSYLSLIYYIFSQVNRSVVLFHG